MSQLQDNWRRAYLCGIKLLHLTFNVFQILCTSTIDKNDFLSIKVKFLDASKNPSATKVTHLVVADPEEASKILKEGYKQHLKPYPLYIKQCSRYQVVPYDPLKGLDASENVVDISDDAVGDRMIGFSDDEEDEEKEESEENEENKAFCMEID